MSQHSFIRQLTVVFLHFFFSSIAASHGAEATFGNPGDLEVGSGSGFTGTNEFLPGMRFPLEDGPAYANSQVYRPGGQHGGSGGQCAASNYSYPWRDNYCEKRSWDMKLCPDGKGHQGQDIRPSTCNKNFYWAVAAEDGIISNIGKYSVTLQSKNGVIYRYLHLEMTDLAVTELDKIAEGQRIGKVSNFFGSTSTTIHLHFDAKRAIKLGKKTLSVYVPPYSSLVRSYRQLIGDLP